MRDSTASSSRIVHEGFGPHFTLYKVTGTIAGFFWGRIHSMSYSYIRNLSPSEYSYRSAKLLRRAVIVLGFVLALILTFLIGAA